MADYNARMAIVDLGFIDGYARIAGFPDDDAIFECIMDALQRIEEFACSGKLLSGMEQRDETASLVLHDLGFVRGWLWTKPIPVAVSEALVRVIRFLTETSEWLESTLNHEQKFEPENKRLSDDQRDKIGKAQTDDGEDTLTAEFAERLGAAACWRDQLLA